MQGLSPHTVQRLLTALEEIGKEYALPYSQRVKTPLNLTELQRKNLLKQVETAEKQCADLANVGKSLAKQLWAYMSNLTHAEGHITTKNSPISLLEDKNRALEGNLKEKEVEMERIKADLREEKARNGVMERLIRELKLEIWDLKGKMQGFERDSPLKSLGKTRKLDVEIKNNAEITTSGGVYGEKESQLQFNHLKNTQKDGLECSFGPQICIFSVQNASKSVAISKKSLEIVGCSGINIPLRGKTEHIERKLEVETCICVSVGAGRLGVGRGSCVSVEGFNYRQLFVESEVEDTSMPLCTSQCRRKHRLRVSRKDPGEEYFALSFQALKLSHPEVLSFHKQSYSPLYAQALVESIPFWQWADWLKRVLQLPIA